MPYRLYEDLSFCRIDGHLIFLDLSNDRYFRLCAPLESAFLRHMSGDEDRRVDISALVERKILVEAIGRTDDAISLVTEPATRSTVEQDRPRVRTPPSAIAHVAKIVLATRLQLGILRLKDTLERMAAYRERHALDRVASAELEPLYVDAARRFMRARRSVPIKTRCLLDSIAIVRYLASRHLRAHIVFGVCADPFSAHCWAQAGSLVLNDTVGNVGGHVPIRVI